MLQRVLPNCDASFAPLRDVINKRFWPSVFGGQISTTEQHLFSLPNRFGGMGIFDPVELKKKSSIHYIKGKYKHGCECY